jgi:hypothetical protein
MEPETHSLFSFSLSLSLTRMCTLIAITLH